jgi:hypothetical protein
MMERCPNCGTPARPGAKFCTTCGFRFPGDGSDGESGHEHTTVATAATSDEEPGLFPGAATDGWPAPPPPAEMEPAGWEAPSGAPGPASAETDETIEVDAASESWTAGAVDSWPARPAVAVTDTPPAETEPQRGEDTETQPVESFETADDNQADTAEAMARAMHLLDELRQVITEIGPSGAVNLSGVVSDLEVAVNPPGAMAADDVAELRDALVAARERPRDVDTILDLTTRIDAMLALVIAYDRTIAAIERTLETLRG